ncbi:MAG: ABC transporter ATP-binding protein [Rikenellaceae bacterium]|nr:ABC transporter ATP-binding protein [Rikenellaceae bacterium]
MKKILGLIPQSFRRRGIGVLLSILVQALLDFVGLAVLLPVIILVADPNAISTNRWLGELWAWGGFTDGRTFTLAVCGAVVGVIAIKGGLGMWLWRGQNRYIMGLYRHYSERLFAHYHNNGLLFIKGHNSAKLAHEINFVCLAFVVNVLMTAAVLATNVILMTLMIVALMVYNVKVAGLLIAILVPIVALYFHFVRGRIGEFGRKENEIRRSQNRLVVESLVGYSEIEVAGMFPEMERRFDQGIREIADMRLQIGTLSQVPNIILDLCIAVALAVLVTFRADAVAFGIFAVAAVKILPTAKSIVGRWITLRNNLYTADIVALTTDAQPATAKVSEQRISFKQEIRLEDVSFRFPDGDQEVLENISLRVRKGETIGIKGVSGGGKTTLFNILLGFYPPTKGQITVDNVALTTDNLRKWHNIVGYVPQNVFVMDSTIAENVAMGDPTADREQIKDALQRASLWEFVESLPEGIDTHIGEAGCRLSGGQKQRLGIARALYKRAEVLFFDEATSALDSDTEREITRSIEELSHNQGELTIFIIAHRETSLIFCDRVVELNG